MSARVSWCLLAQDGSKEKGSGTKPPAGWFDKVGVCVGLAILIPGFPPVYAVRPRCSNDVDRGLFDDGTERELARFWGIAPEPGSQVWFFPGGGLVGFGQDTNEVQRLVLAFQGKLKASEVARGPDQRGRS